MNCPFCSSELKVNNGCLAPKCDFCGADLRDRNLGRLRLVSAEGERYTFQKMKTNIFEEHAKQSVEVLKTYHTFDLYILLREVRETRVLVYTGYEVFVKAAEVETEYNDLAIKEYKSFNDWTKRMYVIENILLERQGYFPSKVTDKVLQYMWNQMKSSKRNKMNVQKRKNQKENSKIDCII